MHTRVRRSLYLIGALALSFLSIAAPARAQFQRRTIDELPAAERYHVEAAAGLWFPGANISVTSGGSGVLSGIAGTTIDAKADLGLADQRFSELHLEVRPARRHKFRFQSIPIKYEQTATLQRDVIFNGQRYQDGIPVTSALDWKAYRVGYEFDVVAKNRGYAGFILDAKFTDATVNLNSLHLTEFARARAPIPAVGGVGRVYVVPAISITGEVTGFSVPDGLIKDSDGHYIEVNIYGTVNFNRFVGVQVGYRSLDVGYVVKQDRGAFLLKGMFVGVVARY